MPKRNIPELLIRIIQEELAEFVTRCGVPVEACIATRDGMLVAEPGSGKVSLRLPVMTGTMHSLGSSIATECNLKRCQNIMIEGPESHMILLSVPCLEDGLVLMALASRTLSLGMLLCYSRECSRAICERWSVGSDTRLAETAERQPRHPYVRSAV